MVGLAFVPGCVPTYNKKKVAHLSMDTDGIYLYRPVGFLPLRGPVFAGAAATLVNQFRYMIKLCRMPR